MKIKLSIIIVVLGFCLDFIGALFKILHWKGADLMLIIGTFLKVIGALFFLIAILKKPKFKN